MCTETDADHATTMNKNKHRVTGKTSQSFVVSQFIVVLHLNKFVDIIHASNSLTAKCNINIPIPKTRLTVRVSEFLRLL